jgi:hypothetical protein
MGDPTETGSDVARHYLTNGKKNSMRRHKREFLHQSSTQVQVVPPFQVPHPTIAPKSPLRSIKHSGE